MRRKTSLTAPFSGSPLLEQITSAGEVKQAAKLFGLPCGTQFLGELLVGTHYFYRWHGDPEGILLVLFSGREIFSFEVLDRAGGRFSAGAMVPVLNEAQRLFRACGCSLTIFVEYGFTVATERDATRH